MQAIMEKAARVRLVIFDVDGVLTDGRLYFGNGGDEFKAFHSRDGHGMKMLQNHGVEIAIISGRRAKSVENRMADLQVRHVYLGIEDKRKAFEALLAKLGIEAAQTAFVGDDIIDLPVMRRVGLAIAVRDADPFVTLHAHWQTPRAGGRGAVRDVCELILAAQGRLDETRARYL